MSPSISLDQIKSLFQSSSLVLLGPNFVTLISLLDSFTQSPDSVSHLQMLTNEISSSFFMICKSECHLMVQLSLAKADMSSRSNRGEMKIAYSTGSKTKPCTVPSCTSYSVKFWPFIETQKNFTSNKCDATPLYIINK